MGRKSLITLLIASYYLHYRLDISRIESIYVSGWLLLFCISILYLYSYRKILTLIGFKISALRKLHSLIGYLAVILFLFHLAFKFPSGKFEIILALTFIFITLTGVFGEYINKTFSKKLALEKKEYLYEEIPNYRKIIIDKYENLISEAANAGAIDSIKQELLEKLYLFFSSSGNIVNRTLIQHDSKDQIIKDLNILVDSNNKNLALDLIQLVKEKEALDYSYSTQFILKNWKKLHTILNYIFVIFIIIHVYLVYAFRIK